MFRWLLFWLATKLGVANLLAARGSITVEHFRRGNKIGHYSFRNGIVNEGMNLLLGVMFHGDSAVSTWYAGLINNAGFSALANSDTMASHAGWAEFTSYDEAARVEWAEDAPASRAITNTTTMDFTISASGTLRGIFITSDDTKSGSTGTLWATASFASPVAVEDDDVLKITYTVSG